MCGACLNEYAPNSKCNHFVNVTYTKGGAICIYVCVVRATNLPIGHAIIFYDLHKININREIVYVLQRRKKKFKCADGGVYINEI